MATHPFRTSSSLVFRLLQQLEIFRRALPLRIDGEGAMVALLGPLEFLPAMVEHAQIRVVNWTVWIESYGRQEV